MAEISSLLGLITDDNTRQALIAQMENMFDNAPDEERLIQEIGNPTKVAVALIRYADSGKVTPAAAPVVRLTENTYIQELWHGPTCAFKDMALQMLPYLLTASLRKTGEEKTVCILVATSGDTGKAALEGFLDVPGTRCCVFYPREGVSQAQQMQMKMQRMKLP